MTTTKIFYVWSCFLDLLHHSSENESMLKPNPSCGCVIVCASRFVSEQLLSVTVSGLVSLQLSSVAERQQVLLPPLVKVSLTPFKKWGHTRLFCICWGFGVSVHSGALGWSLIIHTSSCQTIISSFFPLLWN